jgi:hypothetical protein
MKILTAAILTLTMATTAQAEITREDMLERCGQVSNLAAAIMEERQSGVTMQVMMERLKGSEFSLSLVMAAYKQRQNMSEEHQQKSVNEFANLVYLKCAKEWESL